MVTLHVNITAAAGFQFQFLTHLAGRYWAEISNNYEDEGWAGLTNDAMEIIFLKTIR